MRSGIMISALVLCLSTAARAEEAASEAEPSWSLGAGLGGTGILRGKITEVSQPGPNTIGIDAEITTSPTVFIEHRVGRGLWLLGRASFDYTSSTVGPTVNTAASTTNGAKATTLEGSLGLGLRAVLANLKKVQISGFGMAGFGITNFRQRSIESNSDEGIPTAESDGYSAGASFGVMCDAFLTQNVGLRLSTPLVGVTYTKATLKRIDSETAETPSSSITGGLRLSPSLELRIVF